MRRFYVDPKEISGNNAVLAGNEARHITSVLRLQPGSSVEIFDGTGQVYQAEIEQVSAGNVSVRIVDRYQLQRNTPSPVTLAQCLLKGKKMDLLVQKATELGVACFQPVAGRYCENRGNRERQHKRWQRIMLEACKQCHRADPMVIQPTIKLTRLNAESFSRKIMPWEKEETSPLPFDIFTRSSGPVCLLIGPEGGFHPDEVDWAYQQGFQIVSLGHLTLRAETAALAALSIVQYLTGVLQPSPQES